MIEMICRISAPDPNLPRYHSENGVELVPICGGQVAFIRWHLPTKLAGAVQPAFSIVVALFCLCVGRKSDHEKAQHRWNSRWSRLLGLGAVLASVVAKQCGAFS